MENIGLDFSGAYYAMYVIATAVVSIFLVCVGIWFGNSKESVLSDKLDLYNLQMEYVYEPLYKLFLFKFTPKQVLDMLDGIFEESMAMIPPAIEQKYLALKKKDKKDLKTEDFLPIKRIVETDYNWIRRKLGLPYDRNRIHYFCCSFGLSKLLSLEFALYALYAFGAFTIISIVMFALNPGEYIFSFSALPASIPLLLFAGYMIGAINVRVRY